MSNRERTMARQRALQALYQWQQAGDDLRDIEVQFLTEQEMDRVDVEYFKELLHSVPKQLDAIDALLAPYLDRAIDAVDPIERAILRIGVYELKYHPELPFRVVLNEAVQLAKVFGAEQSHRYVNGVLDKVSGTLRAVERRSGEA